MNFEFVEVWKINNHVVVAQTIEDAIAAYKEYMKSERIDEIVLIENEAVMEEKE